jgi:hypothetical protein
LERKTYLTFAVAERVRHSSEARGVEPLFPACYVWMLLVSLSGAKRLETCGIGLLARPRHSGALDR